MNAAHVDAITLVVFLSFWPVWLVWELLLLWWRRNGGEMPGTISMVALRRGWHLSSIVYLWSGLAAHWWAPTDRWGTVAGGVAFWLISAALLVQDVVLWRSDESAWPKWLRWQRWPVGWLVLGAVAGYVLFPQRGVVSP